MNGKEKIKGKLVGRNDSIEFSELVIIILKLNFTQRQKDIEDAKKQYKLYKNLNPKYFENVITLKEAKLKVDSSDIIHCSRYNISWSY
ncbi:MAG: hypothetical protein ACW98A_17110 [Candidatus Hodarchaeales archaeon]|jgi:hypothetical protein